MDSLRVWILIRLVRWVARRANGASLIYLHERNAPPEDYTLVKTDELRMDEDATSENIVLAVPWYDHNHEEVE